MFEYGINEIHLHLANRLKLRVNYLVRLSKKKITIS